MNCGEFLSSLSFFSGSISLSFPISFSPSLLSISKGQMFPAVTVAPHWYSALNLAESRAAVYICFRRPHRNLTRKRARRERGREREPTGPRRIKGSENYEGNGKERTDGGEGGRGADMDVTSSDVPRAFLNSLNAFTPQKKEKKKKERGGGRVGLVSL